jgi:hypothetical protein
MKEEPTVFMVRKTDVVKILQEPEKSHRLSEIPVEILMEFFTE